jgi:hypothetical protein
VPAAVAATPGGQADDPGDEGEKDQRAAEDEGDHPSARDAPPDKRGAGHGSDECAVAAMKKKEHGYLLMIV